MLANVVNVESVTPYHERKKEERRNSGEILKQTRREKRMVKVAVTCVQTKPQARWL